MEKELHVREINRRPQEDLWSAETSKCDSRIIASGHMPITVEQSGQLGIE
jgi:hypothetical protein